MAPVKILYAETDRRLANIVKRGLHRFGHVVDLVHDGRIAKQYAESFTYDVILLDVLLSVIDGSKFIVELARSGDTTPIVVLSILAGVEELVAGLNAGASDYIRKPFILAELHARLRTVARARSQTTCIVEAGGVTLDLATREVRRDGRLVAMTIRETAFLEFFIVRAGQLITRTMIEASLWENGRYIESNVAEVYVSRLRRKLHASGAPPLITTLRGAGYRFC